MSILVDQGAVQIVQLMNRVNQKADRGPEAVRLLLDFSLTGTYILDLQNLQSTRSFEGCWSIKVINRSGTNMTVTFPLSGDSFTAQANTEGWYSVICPNPVKIQFDCAGANIVEVFLCNVPIPGVVWSTI